MLPLGLHVFCVGALYGVGRSLNPDRSSYGVNTSLSGIVRLKPFQPSPWANLTKDATVERVVPFGDLAGCPPGTTHCYKWGYIYGLSASAPDGAFYATGISSQVFNHPKTEIGDVLLWDGKTPETPPMKVATFATGGSTANCMAYDRVGKRVLILGDTRKVVNVPDDLRYVQVMAISHDGSAPRPVKQLFSFSQSYPVPGRPGEFLGVAGDGHCAYSDNKLYFTGQYYSTAYPRPNTSNYLHAVVDLSDGSVSTKPYAPLGFFPQAMSWLPKGSSQVAGPEDGIATVGIISGAGLPPADPHLLAGFVNPSSGEFSQAMVLAKAAAFGDWSADLGSAIFCPSTDTWDLSASNAGRVYLIIGYMRNNSVAQIPMDGLAIDLFSYPEC
jgi:hypothetical protein